MTGGTLAGGGSAILLGNTICGETLDYVALGMNFMGLIQTGFWGCFDEFIRTTGFIVITST